MIQEAGLARDGWWEREAWYDTLTITMAVRARLDHTMSGQASTRHPIWAALASIQK